jgi:DNA ligase-1
MEPNQHELGPSPEEPTSKGGLRLFANLVTTLGDATKTNDKLNALAEYFASAGDRDKVWVIAIFSGRRPKRAVNSTQLKAWCIEMTNLAEWLFDECYHTVGDLAETIALLLPANNYESPGQSLHFYLQQLIYIDGQSEEVRKKFILDAWNSMDRVERFVFNKLITGGFRIGVSQTLMVKALARTKNLEPAVIAHRITGNWDPLNISFDELLNASVGPGDPSQPYPFYLAYALDLDWVELGDPAEWQAEWKWDGIRGQIIKRAGQFFVWSRGEELLTSKFPEYLPLSLALGDGTVLDGEIICLSGDAPINSPFIPLPFSSLQTRIGRKNTSKKQLLEAPVGFIAYDLLEFESADFRGQPMEERRNRLEEVVASVNHPVLRLSPVIPFNYWEVLTELRQKARQMGSEGIMLKRKISVYQSGRKRGDWWKWKIDPLVIDAVMIYAQKGHGRRSNLYTDYTFAVKQGEQLISFTKAYSGLTDKEIAEVDQFVKRNSLEKFGPVRTVKPELVFEIAFEGIAASNRHKSGIALRFPRINRWRKDKKPDEINTLDDLKEMLNIYGNKK